MTSAEAQAVFEGLRRMREQPIGEMTLEDLRVAGEAFGDLTAEPAGVRYRDEDAVGVPAQWIEPGNAERFGVLLYLHGGGYMMGSVNSHRKLIGHLCHAVAVRGVAIDYRLAPEHAHPAQVDDATTAYRWLLDAGHDPSTLAIGGDSAGGGLTVLTLLRLRDEGLPMPAAAFCMSGWFDLEGSGESMRSNADLDLMIDEHGIRHAAEAFLGGGDPKDPSVAPLYADLSGLPPIYLQVGAHEALHDDSVRLHERLLQAGVAAELDVAPEMQHVFQMYAGNVPESDDAVQRLGEWLAQHLPAARSGPAARVGE